MFTSYLEQELSLEKVISRTPVPFFQLSLKLTVLRMILLVICYHIIMLYIVQNQTFTFDRSSKSPSYRRLNSLQGALGPEKTRPFFFTQVIQRHDNNMMWLLLLDSFVSEFAFFVARVMVNSLIAFDTQEPLSGEKNQLYVPLSVA